MELTSISGQRDLKMLQRYAQIKSEDLVKKLTWIFALSLFELFYLLISSYRLIQIYSWYFGKSVYNQNQYFSHIKNV